MSRIAATFAALRADGRAALIPYVAAGDPSVALTVPLMHALVRGGADVIELGVPFSDPMADGPVIQRAAERAIRNGVGLATTLALVADFRVEDARTPVVLMGYANPIEHMGRETFIAQAAAAGVDGVLVVDYPPEECAEFASALRAQSLDPIFLVAPTSSPARMALIASHASGYIYYVSVRGTTGAAHLDLAEVARHLPRLRELSSLPIGVGFGIREPAAAARVAGLAEAVIIGSKMISEIEHSAPADAARNLERLTRSFREAMDAGKRKETS